MAIQKKEFGVMPSGEKVYEYTLTNKAVSARRLLNLGQPGPKCWFRTVMATWQM